MNAKRIAGESRAPRSPFQQARDRADRLASEARLLYFLDALAMEAGTTALLEGADRLELARALQLQAEGLAVLAVASAAQTAPLVMLARLLQGQGEALYQASLLIGGEALPPEIALRERVSTLQTLATGLLQFEGAEAGRTHPGCARRLGRFDGRSGAPRRPTDELLWLFRLDNPDLPETTRAVAAQEMRAAYDAAFDLAEPDAGRQPS